ncbi:type III-B CRISPR module-associated protein Cmr5 [Rhodoflexus caldus]|uniref:type III-B CRISPR module-associated protein Cmr5 n=1 Tax=Rhodoflexus caldus TaxID=2891236 RepID=UPI002029BC17|nr:type III-B CRISPR module-associated protein Cmr5 [Rhodoflexus caldus]
MKSIAQARAKFAWECAKDLGSDKFSTSVDKVPTYIKTNGLLNTMAFCYSKADYESVFLLIIEWLTGNNQGDKYPFFTLQMPIKPKEALEIRKKEKDKDKKLSEAEKQEVERKIKSLNDFRKSAMETLVGQCEDTKQHIALTTEVLALLNWLRRFAKSE